MTTRLSAGIPSQFLVFGLSLLLHVGVVGLGLIQWSFSKSLHVRLDRPVVYQVDLVTLAPPAPGKPLPAKQTASTVSSAPEQAKPAPAPPQPAAVPPAPQPKAEVKIPEQPKKAPAPAKPAERPKEAKPAPAPKQQPAKAPQKKAEPTREQILAEALGAAQKDVAQRGTLDEREQALASLRQGVASGTGGALGEPGGVSAGSLVEVYAQMVESRVKSHWRFPQIGSRLDLSATLEIQLSLDGHVLGSKVIRSSGRPDFDASTERAVEEAGQLPAPPRPEMRTLRITFNLEEL
ncbi:MAG TPA: cell envelope integrity protein TolA [Desulfonatronum sp.]|nr:cell envelope integrity protein TolA [Desulfonatronum sp.]